MRAKLREAILAGFSSPASLDQVLTDNDMFRHNIAIGPDLATRVNSLIDVAHQEGWLIKLCSVLADARPDNERVSSEILRVQEWLKDQRNINEINEEFHTGVSLHLSLFKSSSINPRSPLAAEDPSSLFSLEYVTRQDGAILKIIPACEYLNRVWNGGVLLPVHYWHSPFKLLLPTLDLKFVNNSDRTIFVTEVLLRVKKSISDQRPIVF